MRRTLLLMATTALALLVASGVALAASINCPNASGGSCTGTNADDALYGTPQVDRMDGRGGEDLMYGYGANDRMEGGDETGLGDKMRGGGGADTMLGQRGGDALYGGTGDDTIRGGPGNDLIEGNRGNDTLSTGAGSDRVNAQDGQRDRIICTDASERVFYDAGLDVLEGCGEEGVSVDPVTAPGGPFEDNGKVLIKHQKGKKKLCVPEAALRGHLEHGDEILDWSGCSASKKKGGWLRGWLLPPGL